MLIALYFFPVVGTLAATVRARDEVGSADLRFAIGEIRKENLSRFAAFAYKR
jgi:hypothetical protein